MKSPWAFLKSLRKENNCARKTEDAKHNISSDMHTVTIRRPQEEFSEINGRKNQVEAIAKLLIGEEVKISEIIPKPAISAQNSTPVVPRIDKKETNSLPIRRKIGEKVYVQVGIDFGTSATKIAFLQLGQASRDVQIIQFDHKLNNYPSYCLPSVVAFDGTNLLFGEKAAKHLQSKPWDTGFKHLKVVVAGKYSNAFKNAILSSNFEQYLNNSFGAELNITPEEITAMYLAHVIRIAKNKITEMLKEENIDFAFNVCVPIDHTQNNMVKTIFENILTLAECIEIFWGQECSSSELIDLAKQCADIQKGPDSRIYLVPESVAQIASYLNSLQVRSGLHAVIDFGAGTTDVSIFDLFRDKSSDSTSYWYAARNIPRGSCQMDQIIAKHLQSMSLNELIVSDEDISQVWKNMDEGLEFKVATELRELWNDSREVWKIAYGHLRKQSAWEKDNVQIFICGGASRIPFIKDIFCNSWMDGWGPYPIRILPTPEDYRYNVSEAPFERLSVAYGLAQPKPELGEYVLPDDVPDHTPLPLPRRHIPSHEEIYIV